MAGCVVVGVSSCSEAGESNEQTAEVEQKVTGPDATVVHGATGVVDFTHTIAGYRISCTGSMIAPHVILTAARCFLPYPAFGIRNGPVEDATIHYYDPKAGRRAVHTGPANWFTHPNFPFSTLATGFADEANRAKYNPKRWRRLVRSILAYWFAHPSLQEAIDALALTAKWDLAVIVVPEVLGSLDSGATDYHDYLRLYSDDKHDLENGEQKAYGAGFYGEDGSDDQLRYGAFNAEAEDGYLKLEGRQGDDALNMCRGDNGGPFEYSVTIGGQSFPTIAGVWSNFNALDASNDCASDAHGHDDSYVCLMEYSNHVAWLESVAGVSCASQSGGSHNYRRCFDLPYIEDVPGEGLLAPDVATAVVAAALR